MTLKTLERATQEGKNRKILVAIDFGTTYSGIAWAQSARPDIQDCIVQWPDSEGSLQGKTSEKVPTELVYINGEIKWGFQVPDSEYRHQWFKLRLDPNQVDHVSHLSVEFPDPKALPPDYEHDPVRLSTDYLTCFRKHTEEILRLKLGQGVINSTPIEYTLTVPAIWDDAAKDRTQSCAANAGMGSAVRLVTEPEAAAVYTLDAMDPHNLQKDDKFVLCDAGGGTVDLITYTILDLHPKVKVREAVAGDGEACGGTFLNRIFGRYLQDNFGDDGDWDDDLREEAMKSFESAKKEFTGDKPLIISVIGLPDDASRGIKRGRLTIPASAVKGMFEPVITQITSLVRKQLKAAKTAKAVLLVGGFGGSVYLRKCIERVVGPSVEVIQPPNGWIAIEKGALIWALNQSSPETSRISIASRKARKHYGVRCHVLHELGVHAVRRKFWSEYEGQHRVDVMSWIVKKGDDIDQSKPVVMSYYKHRLVSDGPFTTTNVGLYQFSSEAGSAPMYPNSSAKLLVDLTANLSTIGTTLIPIRKGSDGLMYYHLSFEIRVAFFSGHTEYALWYQGKEYGKVEAEYA